MQIFRCPLCKSTLSQSLLSFGCSSCNREYPVIAGIADFRVYPDPYIDLEADRNKGLHLAEKSREMTFAELVRYYYSITPEVPADLGDYYTNHHLAGVSRGQGLLDRLHYYNPTTSERIKQSDAIKQTANVLDLGCGTGGFLCAAGTKYDSLIGVDIAFRWLVVARKRLEEAGFDNVNLVCACADYLPFEENQYDVVIAENLIEHVKDAKQVMTEIERVRKPNSRVMARTVNRYAFGPEPHVGVWGVGYLPRPLMNFYVKTVKGIPYEHIYLQGRRSLEQAVRKSGITNLQVRRAKLMPSDYSHHQPWKQKLFKAYDRVASSSPLLSSILTEIGPYLDLTSTPVKSNEHNKRYENKLDRSAV